ncbi:hypothetical protein [Kitasatospora cinereorecta]|uniref:Transcriptional regulator n=1 Tax=Kitasatospora cinereorecta TaxID=285560 RepID=A0ABW0VEM9_9ACTN
MTSDEERPAVTRAPNRQLSALIEQAGLSNKQLARAIRETAARYGSDARCTHTSVQRWREGRRSRAVPPALIAETLSLALGRVVTPAEIGMPVDGEPSRPLLDTGFIDGPEELAAAARRLWEGDLGQENAIRADLPIGALSGPALHWLLAEELPAAIGLGPGPEVTAADVHRLRATLQAFELIAGRHGGAAAHRPVVQYLLSDLGRLLTGSYPAEVGRALFRAAAEGALHAGSCAQESGLPGLGRRYRLLGLFLAHRAGDRTLGGRALVALAASYTAPTDQPAALDLLRAAVLGTRHQPGPALAAAHAAEARAYATLRDAAAADRALALARAAAAAEAVTEAEVVATTTEPDPADEPAAAPHPFDPRELAEAEIRCRLALGEHEAARRAAELALPDYGPDDTVRSVLVGCLLATARIRGGLLDGACAAGEQALRQAAGVQSAEVEAQLGRLAAELEAQREGGRAAALAALIRARRQALPAAA